MTKVSENVIIFFKQIFSKKKLHNMVKNGSIFNNPSYLYSLYAAKNVFKSEVNIFSSNRNIAKCPSVCKT